MPSWYALNPCSLSGFVPLLGSDPYTCALASSEPYIPPSGLPWSTHNPALVCCPHATTREHSLADPNFTFPVSESARFLLAAGMHCSLLPTPAPDIYQQAPHLSAPIAASLITLAHSIFICHNRPLAECKPSC